MWACHTRAHTRRNCLVGGRYWKEKDTFSLVQSEDKRSHSLRLILILKSTPKEKLLTYRLISAFFVKREILFLKQVDKVLIFILGNYSLLASSVYLPSQELSF